MEAKPNGALKGAIHERGFTGRKLAAETGIPYSYISWALSGRFILTEEQRRSISKTLRFPMEKLFPSEV
jgi:transcriptional regulator with XRE-family HTH domain